MEEEKSDALSLYDQLGRDFAEKCTHCGECLRACSAFPLTRVADRGPETVIGKVTDLLGGGDPSEEAYEMAFSCSLGCTRVCTGACPEGLMPMLGLQMASVKLREVGKEPPYLTYLTKPGSGCTFNNALTAIQMKPSEARWHTQVPADPRPVDVVVFSGCGVASLPHLMQEAVDIFDSIGIDYALLAGGELCCGNGLTTWGDHEGGQQFNQEMISAISAFRPKKVVFFCTGCLSTVMTAALSIDIPFEYITILQFLEENMDRIPFSQRIDKTVTLHESCNLHPVAGSYDRIRRLLGAVPGLTLVELEHNRENALCCGGITEFSRPEIADQLRRIPLEEAKASGAEVLVNTCSACHRTFTTLEDEYPFEINHYISLLAECIGKSYEDKYKKYSKYQSLGEVLAETRENIEASGFTLKEVERVLKDYYAFVP